MGESREASEQLALVLNGYGMQRMHARVLAALLTTDNSALTQGELTAELGAATGSVSNAVKQLIAVGLVERVPVAGSRREHYRLRDDAWARLFTRQNHVFDDMLGVARKARDHMDADSLAHRRLTDMCDFYDFLLAEVPALLERWDEERKRRS